MSSEVCYIMIGPKIWGRFFLCLFVYVKSGDLLCGPESKLSLCVRFARSLTC